MEFVSARDLRLNPKKVWGKLHKNSTGVVTFNGQPYFLITKLDPKDLEEIILIQNRLRAELALSKMRASASEKGLDKMTSEEIDSVIDRSRRNHKS